MRYLIVIETDEGTLTCWAQNETSGRLLCQLLSRRSAGEIISITLHDQKKQKTLLIYGETGSAT